MTADPAFPATAAAASPEGFAAEPVAAPRNAAELYERISADAELTRSLFRQALQNPSGALARIVAIGAEQGLTLSADEVKAYIAGLDDGATKQWLLKARGGL